MPVWLLSAVTERDLPRLLLLLAHSTKDQINAELSGSTSPPRTALHAACQLGDVVMTQLLVWVGFSFFFSTQRPVLYSCVLRSHFFTSFLSGETCRSPNLVNFWFLYVEKLILSVLI